MTITLACAGETASYLTVMIAGKQAWLNKAGCTVVGPGKDWVTVQMTRAQARRRGLMAEPVPLAA